MREIILLDEAGRARASLPIFDVINTVTMQPFDGDVSRDEILTLRVNFAGLADPYSFFSGSDARASYSDNVRLRIVLEADNADDEIIVSPEIWLFPDVAT